MKNQTSQVSKKVKYHDLPLSKNPNPIVWALDPSEVNPGQIKLMQDITNIWSAKNQEVIIASIFTPFDLGWILKVSKSLMLSTVSEIQIALQKKVATLGISEKNLQVLPSIGNSLRERVQTLIHFTVKKKTEVLLVNSQGQSKSHFTGLGSFCEALISLSPTPVLVVGNRVEKARLISKIFFPTDFSDRSETVFKSVLKFAQKWDAEVIIYHHMDLGSGPLAYGIPWGFDINWVDEYWENHALSSEKKAEKWIQMAQKKLNIKCHYICDRKMGGLSAQMLEKAQDEKADLLVLGVKRGPWSQVILGRIVRNLFAEAQVPILILHANYKKRLQNEKRLSS